LCLSTTYFNKKNMKRQLLFSLALFLALTSSVFAQHSLQIDDGSGNYTIITGSGSGGTYTFPNGGGTILTTGGGTTSGAWLLGGNTGAGVNNLLGTLDNTDLNFITGLSGPNIRMTILAGGNIGLSPDGNPFTPLTLFHVGGTVPSTSSNGTTNVRINTLAGVPQTFPALTAQDGIVIAGTDGDLKKYDVSQIVPASVFADFYALMPPDNAAPVFPGFGVEFPQNGPASGGILNFPGPFGSFFFIPTSGTYEITFQVSIDEPGQLAITQNGILIPSSVVGRATGTSQITGMSIITLAAGDFIQVVNPPAAFLALTITPNAGGFFQPVSAHLIFKRLQ
jgi:hypothetical protein